MVLSLVKAAYAAYRSRGGHAPAPGTKDWWADRACMFQDQLQTLLPAEHGDSVPGLGIVSVNPATHNMSAYRTALMSDVLAWTQWPVMVSHLQRLCPWASNAIRTLTGNMTDERKKRKHRDENEERRLKERAYAYQRGVQNEMILSIIQRQRSIHNQPLLLVLKSMVAFRQGLNDTYWRAESKMRLLMSYNWTHDFILELSDIGVTPPFALATNVAFCVYDNCDYHKKKALDRHGDGAEYIKTVTIASLPVKARLQINQNEIGESICHTYTGATSCAHMSNVSQFC